MVFIDWFQPLPRNLGITVWTGLLASLPVLASELPILLSCDLAARLSEPRWHKLLATLFSETPARSLRILQTILLISSKIVLSILHSPLIRSKARVSRWKPWSELVIDMVESQDEWRQVERNASWSLVGLPDEIRTVGVCKTTVGHVTATLLRFIHGCFVAWG